MSKPTPPGNRPDRAADELFDTDMLSDSDDDFLAELDRVLGADSVPTPPKPSTPPPQPAGAPDFASLKRKIDALSDHRDPDATIHLDSDSLPTEDEPPTPDPTYGRRGEPPATPPPAKPAVAQRPAPRPAPPASEAKPQADKGPENREEFAPKPARPLPQGPRPHSVPPQPSSVAPVPAASGGLSLLLGLLGTALGGGALWLTLQRPVPRPTPLPVAQQGIEVQRHFNELDHRIEMVRQQIEDHGDQAEREIGQQRERLDHLAAQIQASPASGDLETRLQAQMAEVHAHLAEVQDQLAASTQAARKAAAPPNPTAKTTQPRKGGWAVNLESFAHRKVAENERDKLKARGLNAALTQVRIKGRAWYRLYVSGFATRAEAKAALVEFKEKYGLSSAWLGRAPKG